LIQARRRGGSMIDTLARAMMWLHGLAAYRFSGWEWATVHGDPSMSGILFNSDIVSVRAREEVRAAVKTAVQGYKAKIRAALA